MPHKRKGIRRRIGKPITLIPGTHPGGPGERCTFIPAFFRHRNISLHAGTTLIGFSFYQKGGNISLHAGTTLIQYRKSPVSGFFQKFYALFFGSERVKMKILLFYYGSNTS